MDYPIFLSVIAIVFVVATLIAKFLLKRSWFMAVLLGLFVATLASTALDISEGMIGEPLRVAAIDNKPRLSSDPWYKFTGSMILWLSVLIGMVFYLLTKLKNLFRITRSENRNSNVLTNSNGLIEMELVNGTYRPIEVPEPSWPVRTLLSIKDFCQKHKEEFVFLVAIGLLVEFLTRGFDRCGQIVKQRRRGNV